MDPVTEHYNGPFHKSNQHFSGGKLVRYGLQKLFVETKVNGKRETESDYFIHHLLYQFVLSETVCA